MTNFRPSVLCVMAELLVMLCLWPAVSLASEGTEDFVSPTRNPNAANYSTTKPEELMPEQLVARAYILMERTTGNILM